MSFPLRHSALYQSSAYSGFNLNQMPSDGRSQSQPFQRRNQNHGSIGYGAQNQRSPTASARNNRNSTQHQKKSFAPVNHTWETDNSVADIITSEVYDSCAMVMWVDGIIGEVLCDRNLAHANIHFFFDGRTEMGESTIALLSRSADGTQLTAGTKVEIETSYVHSEAINPLSHRMIHIKKISINYPAKDFVRDSVCFVSSISDSPSGLSVATTINGDRVLIHPNIFTQLIIKEAIMNCPTSTVEISVADYGMMDDTLALRRTVIGDTLPAPCWVTDVLGLRSSARQIMFSCKPYGQVVRGFGTITRVIPKLAVIITSDDFDDQIFCHIVAVERSEKMKLMLYSRVRFTACPEMPGLTYKYRGLTVSADDSVYRIPPASRPILHSVGMTPTTFESSIREIPAHAHSQSHFDELTAAFQDGYVPHASENLLSFDIVDSRPDSALAPVVLSLSDEWNRDPSDFTVEKVVARSSRRTDSESLASPFDTPSSIESPIPLNCYKDQMTFKMGCSPSDDIEVDKRCERVQPVGAFRFGDEPHCHLVVDAMIERRKKKRKREVTASALPGADTLVASDDSPPSSNIPIIRVIVEPERKSLYPDEAADVSSSSETENAPPPTKRIANIVTKAITRTPAFDPVPRLSYTLPSSDIRVIGLYDDVGLILEQHLRRLPRVPAKIPGGPVDEAPLPEMPRGDGFWFRRRRPRILPTVIVAEFVEDRDIAQDAMDIDVGLLTTTIVVRNETRLPASVLKPAKYSSVAGHNFVAPKVLKSSNGPSYEPFDRITQMDMETPIMGQVTPSVSREIAISDGSAPKTQTKERVMDMIQNDKIFETFFGSLLKNRSTL